MLSIYLVLKITPVLLYKLYNGEIENNPFSFSEDDETQNEATKEKN